jgi:hypothetical protein
MWRSTQPPIGRGVCLVSPSTLNKKHPCIYTDELLTLRYSQLTGSISVRFPEKAKERSR